MHADLADDVSIVGHFSSGASGPFGLSYSFNYSQGAKFFRLVGAVPAQRVIKKEHF